MDSAFSRTRTSPKRKSASRLRCMKCSETIRSPKIPKVIAVTTAAYRNRNRTRYVEMDHSTRPNAASCKNAVRKDQDKCERLYRERADVVRDPLIGVIDLRLRQQLIIGPIIEIAPEKAIRQPAAPIQREPVPDVVVIRVDRNPDHQQPEKDLHGALETRAILRRQRGRKFARLLIEEDRDLGVSNQH